MIPNHLTRPADIAREVYGPQFPLVNRYVDILRSTGIDWGLLGPREADRLWDRHILNSAALSELIYAESAIADIGSGAGLPGIPLSLLRPDLRVALVEPLLRRSTFLTETVEKLGISDRVEVFRGRAEDHHLTYEVVVARAVAPLGRLIEWCNALRAKGGIILALKGRSATDEVAAARVQLDHAQLTADVLSVRAHRDAEPATVVRLGDRSRDLG